MTITTDRIQLLSRMLDVASMRHDVIAQNVANVNTPGYTPMGVSFEEALRQALSPGSQTRVQDVQAEMVPSGGGAAREDGNTVDVDHEMAGLQKNAFYYEVYTQLMANELSQFRSAISGQ